MVCPGSVFAVYSVHMKLKVLFLSVFVSAAAFAQSVTYTNLIFEPDQQSLETQTTLLPIERGKIAKILTAHLNGNAQLFVDVEGSPNIRWRWAVSVSQTNLFESQLPIVVGPAKIGFGFGRGGRGYAAVKITDTLSASTPSSAVVIPADAEGPVEIIMESSKDLITWTRAEPGTYGASTEKRFFRVRAENQVE